MTTTMIHTMGTSLAWTLWSEQANGVTRKRVSGIYNSTKHTAYVNRQRKTPRYWVQEVSETGSGTWIGDFATIEAAIEYACACLTDCGGGWLEIHWNLEEPE